MRVRLDVGLRRHGVLRLGGPARPAHGRRGARRGAGRRCSGRRVDGPDRRRPHRRRRARHRAGVPRRRAGRALGRRSATRWCAGWPGCCRRTCGCRGARAVPADVRRPVLRAVAALRVPGHRRPVRRRAAAPPRHAGLAAPAGPRPRSTPAAAGLIGEHDFAAYCRRKEHATTVRRDQPAGLAARPGRRASWPRCRRTRSARRWCAASSGRCWRSATAGGPVDWPAALLRRRERASEVMVAPPHGLTLVAVGYPDDAGEYAPARGAHPAPAGLTSAAVGRRRGPGGYRHRRPLLQHRAA